MALRNRLPPIEMEPVPMPQPSPPAEPSPPDGKSSLRAVFEAEESRLLRYAFGLTARREVAEEIVQDSFLQLHAHWDEVRQPVAWLYRCVRNRSLNHLRASRREVLRDGEIQHEAPGEGEAPDETLRRLEAAGHLRLLLAELDEGDRALLRLKYEEGLKYREIGERTGLSVSNVGYRLHHLLKGLGAKLHQLGIDSAS